MISRTLIVIFTAFIATSVPKFGLFINMIGSFSGTLIAFILPVIYIEINNYKLTLYRLLFIIEYFLRKLVRLGKDFIGL